MGLAGVLSRWLGPKGFAGMIIVCIVLWILVFDSIWFLVGTVIVSALTVVLGVGVFKKMMRNSLAMDESAADESDVMYNDPQYMDPNDEIQTMYEPNRL